MAATVRTTSRKKKIDGGPNAARPLVARRTGRLATGIVGLVLVVAALVAYSTSFNGVFVFDDQFAIVRNPNIRRLWPLTEAMSSPPESPVSTRPVMSLSLAISYALAPPDVRDVMGPGGPDAAPGTAERFLRNVWGYHLMNLALHVLVALALVGVIRRTLNSERLKPRFGDVSTIIAGAVALVWVVHPLTTDAVTYITQRTELLMGLFYLLTLYCAIRAYEVRESESPRVREADFRTFGRLRPHAWNAAAVAACALGMGSKQTMATAPLVVLAWDWIFATRLRRLRWPLYGCLAATLSIPVVGLMLERWPHSIGVEGWTPWTYLLTQTGVITHYLRLAFVPVPLVLDYDGWPMARSLVQVAPYALLVAALFIATAVLVLRRQPWGFVGVVFFAVLAPSSSVLPLTHEIAAERRMYLSLASVVVLAVVGSYLIGQRLLARLVRDARARRTAGAVIAAVLVGGLVVTFATMTNARNRDYWSEEQIWRDAVEKRPDNPRARLNYGVDLFTWRRYAEAEQQLREAVRLRDADASAHGNLGAVLCSLGQLDEGVAHVERALALDPDYQPGYGNLAEAYGALGRRALAAKYFALAVDKEPDNPFLLSRLGWLLATSPEDGVRNGARAVEVSERAVRITSRQDTMSLDTLAAAYAEVGRFDQAVSVAQESLALATRQGDQANAAASAQRLALYQSGQKFRESQ
ncbi:MAG: tetratricopeptide repeat protein [Bacteroidales bacterium]